jgi:hypothetical protein
MPQRSTKKNLKVIHTRKKDKFSYQNPKNKSIMWQYLFTQNCRSNISLDSFFKFMILIPQLLVSNLIETGRTTWYVLCQTNGWEIVWTLGCATVVWMHVYVRRAGVPSKTCPPPRPQGTTSRDFSSHGGSLCLGDLYSFGICCYRVRQSTEWGCYNKLYV